MDGPEEHGHSWRYVRRGRPYNTGVKALLLALGIFLLAFGLGCLNYTTDGGTEHHRAWARRRGLPEPSGTIFLAGAAFTAVGAGLAGFAVGRRRA